ncbi:MAG: tRNA (adenosine(37)-N6)-threonylcarbamoyltransferase complex dimerization subunit type 1 TsaB [Desulfuromonas sp.]|nr:MAG: tRNA (adenosine(37)-N6)-threonylcarbamoyltransferase complex dimerization subunit type 1 TsaB [Desulfuromonas sp.]
MTEVLLTLATATRTASVALTAGEELLAEVTFNPPTTQSEVLLPAVEQALSGVNLDIDSVDAIAVVVGPGAFTGLRVGVATAKGLALATGKPLIGISSLEALAMQVPDVALPVCALLDARKGEVYAGHFEWQSGMPQASKPEEVVDPELLLQAVSGNTLFVGDGSEFYRTLIIRKLGQRALFAPASASVLRAGSVARIALRKFRNGDTVLPENLNPVYISPSDAEINEKRAIGNTIEG